MKLSTRFKKLQTFQKVLIILALVIVGVGGWVAFDNRPRPLGGEMVYLGKEDNGSYLFWTDTAPYTEYTYATNRDPQTIGANFNAAIKSINDPGPYTDVTLESNGEVFTFTMYKNDTNKTNDKYIAHIRDSDYQIAQKYVKK